VFHHHVARSASPRSGLPRTPAASAYFTSRLKGSTLLGVLTIKRTRFQVLKLAEEIIDFVTQKKPDEITAITALEVARISFGLTVQKLRSGPASN